MQHVLLLIFLLFSFVSKASDWQIKAPNPLLDRVEQRFELSFEEEAPASIKVNGRELKINFDEERPYFLYTPNGEYELVTESNGEQKNFPISPIPLWLSIFPPLIAILLALVFREVLISLFIGIAFGAIMIAVYAEGIIGFFTGFVRIIDTYIIDAINDRGHISIIVFSMVIGALVGVVSKNGGMKGVVGVLSKFAKNARSGQFATYLLGIVIFFDDYANTLVVGNTMRPVTDRLGISREKLSYIVDSTAAPVASVAFITTWIGAELSYLSSGIAQIPEIQGQESAYGVFLSSLQYAYYPILTLFFIAFIIYLKRDFGPMWSAEMKARAEKSSLEENPVEELERLEDEGEARWYNAVVPILSLIIVAMIGLYVTGVKATDPATEASGLKYLAEVIGNADSYKALLWASLSGLGIAMLMTLGQRLMDLETTMKSIVNGFESLLPAILILILAWSLAIITEQLHTADFLSSLMKGNVSPLFFPLITFVLSALVSFATGSSWGTMAILYPLMLGTSWALGKDFGYDYASNMAIFQNVAACILAGSVLGDHCSPISDTTILSSLATKTDHIQHVRTQMPYAITVGAVAALVGILPAAAGIAWWLLFPLGIAILFGLIKLFGKKLTSV